MKCQKCGMEIQGEAKFCPKCGNKLEQPPLVVEPVVVEPVAVTPVVAEPVKEGATVEVCPVWPEWQIEKQLGKGSYGVVYKAVRKDNNVESHSAIKVISIPSDLSEVNSLRSEGLDNDGTKAYFKGVVDEFVSEIQLMESLKGIQNIVSVEDYKVVEKTDEIGWNIYIRMELLTAFNDYICNKTLSEKEVLKLGSDICAALEICGQRNVIHRDIKPENIFVNDFGHFKLGDFGIARKLENMSGGLSQKGTYNYMAPEVANGKDYDARVDIYSLGIVLYRLLNNNKLPFLDTDKQVLSPTERKNAVERRLRGEELPAPCNASPSAANIILRACAFEPKLRFASATEMKEALIQAAAGTYQIVADDLDATTSVRAAEMDLDATTSVRKAQKAEQQVATPIVNSFGDAPKKKKKGKGKIIALLILIAIVGLAIFLTVSFFDSSAYSVYKDMNSDDYEDALEEYEDGVKDNFIQEMLLEKLLEDRVKEVSDDYKDGKMKYDDAIAALTALDEMGFDGAKEKIEEITKKNDVDTALQKADGYYEEGDYENAITEYSKVKEGDEKYEEAQQKLQKVYVDYIASTVATAKSHNAAKKYKEAIAVVNTAYGVLPDDIDTSELDTVKEESLTAYKTEVSTEVDEFVAESQYAEAFALIDEAIAFDDNEYFQELKTTTESKYVASVTTTVNGYLTSGDYVSAKRVADNSLTVLPGNADLKALQEKVEKDTPTFLLDVCKPYSTDDYTEFVNGETFSMGGKTYTNGFALGWYGYAYFNVDGAYTTMSFMVGHRDDTDMSDTTIKIYCDGILKQEVTLLSGDLPQKITLDITGVSQIKIERSTGWGEYGLGSVTVK